MTFEVALRWTEVLVALALLQRGAEHIGLEPGAFALQMGFAGFLLFGVAPEWMVLGAWLVGLWQLQRFDGPYNGGADKMVLLVLTCVVVARWLPSIAPVALGYLAVQLVLSYFVSGYVKLKSRAWRRGEALSQVFAYSAYPSSQALRALSAKYGLMKHASRCVIWFEVLFPVALAHPLALKAALGLALAFHLANAVLFGLNRFVWAWLSAFPALIWWQATLPI